MRLRWGPGTKGASSVCARMYFLRKVNVGVDSDLNMAPVSPKPRSSGSWVAGALLAVDADSKLPKSSSSSAETAMVAGPLLIELCSPALSTLDSSVSRMLSQLQSFDG